MLLLAGGGPQISGVNVNEFLVLEDGVFNAGISNSSLPLGPLRRAEALQKLSQSSVAAILRELLPNVPTAGTRGAP
jgi:hypothetical protein